MRTELKKNFFIATVESILLYGCESWSLTEADEVTPWYLHQNAAKSHKCSLEPSYDKRNSLWQASSTQ